MCISVYTDGLKMLRYCLTFLPPYCVPSGGHVATPGFVKKSREKTEKLSVCLHP